jgi:hypothetical protein
VQAFRRNYGNSSNKKSDPESVGQSILQIVRRLQRRIAFLQITQRFSLGFNVRRLWRLEFEITIKRNGF